MPQRGTIQHTPSAIVPSHTHPVHILDSNGQHDAHASDVLLCPRMRHPAGLTCRQMGAQRKRWRLLALWTTHISLASRCERLLQKRDLLRQSIGRGHRPLIDDSNIHYPDQHQDIKACVNSTSDDQFLIICELLRLVCSLCCTGHHPTSRTRPAAHSCDGPGAGCSHGRQAHVTAPAALQVRRAHQHAHQLQGAASRAAGVVGCAWSSLTVACTCLRLGGPGGVRFSYNAAANSHDSACT